MTNVLGRAFAPVSSSGPERMQARREGTLPGPRHSRAGPDFSSGEAAAKAAFATRPPPLRPMAALLAVLQLATWGLFFPGCTSSPPRTAFFYGSQPPVEELSRYPRVVVEPQNLPDPSVLSRSGTEVFAYLSLGEAESWRASAAALPADLFLGRNEAWHSRIPDLRDQRWAAYILDQRLAALWAAGYRAFFLDTLDSYKLAARSPEERAQQLLALTDLVARIPQRFPGARLIFNRGFDLLPHVGHLASGIAAESLFEGWDAAHQRYRSVPEADRAWLLHELEEAHRLYRLPVTVIDYVAPEQTALAVATRTRIQAHGFSAWVTTPGLDLLPQEQP